jgi:hypothetical protein
VNRQRVGSVHFPPATSLRYVTTRHCRSSRVSTFLSVPFRVLGRPHCLHLLRPPELYRLLLASLPLNPTTRITLIPALGTSTGMPTLTLQAQTHFTPMRTPSLPANPRRHKRSLLRQRSPTSASSSNTIATAHGTTINNTKPMGSNRRRQRRSPLRMRHSSTRNRHSNNRLRRGQWQIPSRRARQRAAGQPPQRYLHIFVLWWRRSLRAIRLPQGRETITISRPLERDDNCWVTSIRSYRTTLPNFFKSCCFFCSLQFFLAGLM